MHAPDVMGQCTGVRYPLPPCGHKRRWSGSEAHAFTYQAILLDEATLGQNYGETERGIWKKK